jgi:hypothetical protein
MIPAVELPGLVHQSAGSHRGCGETEDAEKSGTWRKSNVYLFSFFGISGLVYLFPKVVLYIDSQM